MDEKRIKIAQDNFRRYLQNNLIKKESYQEIIFNTYYNNALESLKVAEEVFNNKTSFLWVIVSSYYSMFYIACAYFYKKGYKTGHEIVHQVVNESIIVLVRNDIEKHFFEEYEEEKEKALYSCMNVLNNYEFERSKRSEFQYETTGEIKESKAKTSINRAKEFVSIMRLILKK